MQLRLLQSITCDAYRDHTVTEGPSHAPHTDTEKIDKYIYIERERKKERARDRETEGD